MKKYDTIRNANNKRPDNTSNQKTIEFNVQDEKKKEDSEFELLYPKTSKERISPEKKNAVLDYSGMSDEDVDEFENIPAYQRRQLRMNDPKYDRKNSRYSVSNDNEIKDKNSYLHGQVD